MDARADDLDVMELVSDQPDEFRVNTAAYRGQQMFEKEIARIFNRTWIFLCHESELARPGDYKSVLLGTQPVIVSRDEKMRIHAHLNACTHRGATLCRVERGNSRAFVCPYHGWSFRMSGELIGITDAGRYPPGFDKASKNLRKLARVASYGGLVFGCFNPAVEELEDFLGGAKRHIDYWNMRTAGGKYRLAAPHKYGFAGNWKFQSENVYDGYHPGFVHRSAFNTMKKFAGSFSNRNFGIVRQEGLTRGFPQGHGTLESGVPLESAGVDPLIRQVYGDRLKTLYGPAEAAETLNNRHLLIFPNLTLFDFNIRVIQPISHDRTEIYSYPLQIEGVDDAINSNRMLDAQTRVGSAGILSADDIDVFAGNQNALSATGADWITLTRGHGMEQVLPSGEHLGAYSDEAPQRAFWRKWKEMMKSPPLGNRNE